MNALGHPSRQSEIDLTQPQHLQALNDSQISRRAGRSDGVMRPGDFHVQGHFSRRVVGNCTGIMMVRPELYVVTILADVVDLVFGLDIAMLGHSQIDAHSGAVDRFQVYCGIGKGFAASSKWPRTRLGCRGGVPFSSGISVHQNHRPRPGPFPYTGFRSVVLPKPRLTGFGETPSGCCHWGRSSLSR